MNKKIIASKLFSFFIIFSLISVSIIITLPNATAEPLYFTELNINYSSDGQPSIEQIVEEEIILSWKNNSPDTECNEYTNYEYSFSTNYSGSSYSIKTNASWISIGSVNGTVYGFSIHGIYYINVTANNYGNSIYYNYTLTVIALNLYWILIDAEDYNSNNTTYYAKFIVNHSNVTFTILTNVTWLIYEISNSSNISELIIYGISEIGEYDINITASYLNTNIYYNYTLIVGEGDNMETIILIIWVILMIVFLLISLKYTEWGILGGIIWLLAGLLEFIALNTSLGLIVISVGMFIMLYGILELFKR